MSAPPQSPVVYMRTQSFGSTGRSSNCTPASAKSACHFLIDRVGFCRAREPHTRDKFQTFCITRFGK